MLAERKSMAHTQVMPTACHTEGLADILERVLDKGVVIAGDIKIKLCDIELLTIQIRLLIASVDKAREMGLTWWWQPPQQQIAAAAITRRRAQAAAAAICRRKAPGKHYEQFRQRARASRTHLQTTTKKTERYSHGQSAKGPNQDAHRPTTPAARNGLRTSASISAASWASSAASMEKLVDLAETGQNLSQTGELKGLDPQGKLRGVYGFSIKTGIGDQGEREVKIEPFGNIRRESSGDAVVEDVREPLVDVYEEEDHVLVLAEIPGVSKKDVQLELSGDRLTIRAQRGEKRYRKEVALPQSFTQQNMHWECTNGILKIRLER